ncbi:MAG: four helix bundle protein [Ignavibacteriaceae bacterium]|nr:four helix bundle protein [Ignavibacteriaceae bacterium]
MKKEYEKELSKRLFEFAVRTIKYLRTIKNEPEISVIKYQLSKSSTSSGANYEEAQAAVSTNDFSNKVSISLKEMRESNYWFRICNELKLGNQSELKLLLSESDELKKILGSISYRIRNRK